MTRMCWLVPSVHNGGVGGGGGGGVGGGAAGGVVRGVDEIVRGGIKEEEECGVVWCLRYSEVHGDIIKILVVFVCVS